MDPASSATHVQHKKQDDDNKAVDKRDVKPVVKTLNRVPRMFHSVIHVLDLYTHCHHPGACVSSLRLSNLRIHANSYQQNACRKQKMRCEGADNPPCRRCRHAGLECLFEKPTREATLTGEAGLESVGHLTSHDLVLTKLQAYTKLRGSRCRDTLHSIFDTEHSSRDRWLPSRRHTL